MKILLISSYFLPYISGAIMYPARILKHFAQAGHNVRVLTFKHDPDLPDCQELQGITIRRLPYELKIHKGFLSFSYPFRVMGEIRRADVIIFNQPVFEGLFVIGIARLFGKKIISLVNCDVDLGSGFKNGLLTRMLRMAISMQLFLSHEIVTYTRDYALSSRLLRRFVERMRFIVPAVEKNPVSQAKKQELQKLKKGDTWVCYCGRVSREKGLEHFVRSYRHLRDGILSSALSDELSGEHSGVHSGKRAPRQAKARVVYVFAGPFGEDVAGEKDYFRFIKAECELMSVPHLFLGSIGNDELGALYEQIDCLVLPSINGTEAFGIVQLEAMRFGKPVVASDLPGVRVPVLATGMGYLCRPADPLDLAEKIGRVLINPDFIASDKRQRFEIAFDPAISIKGWDNLIG